MTTTASLPTPAHQLSNPTPTSSDTTSSDVNYQGLPIPRGPVTASLSFYKAPEDGSPPHPTYVDRPETYNRPFETHPAIVHDVTGRENEYTLDGNGFQFHKHTSVEKDFLDDAQIKAQYYPETEQLLKDA